MQRSTSLVGHRLFGDGTGHGWPMARRTVAGVTALLIGLVACSTGGSTLSAGGYRGVELIPARAKPDFTLTATDGRPFHFAADTRGILTLLFFGYTSCPDVCPVHMANIAAVLDQMPPEDQSRVRVVFVTTDPKRDTPQRLRAWLDNFQTGFIGLIGDPDSVNAIQAALGLPPAVVEIVPGQKATAEPSYGVGHAAQVLLFTADDSLRLEYPFGTRQEDWAADLSRLLKAEPNKRE